MRIDDDGNRWYTRDTFFGPLKFNAAGQNVTKSMAVIQIRGGQPKAVWPKNASESPLTWPGGRS